MMYPLGHARHSGEGLEELFTHKFNLLAGMGCDDADALRDRISPLSEKQPGEIQSLYSFSLRD